MSVDVRFSRCRQNGRVQKEQKTVTTQLLGSCPKRESSTADGGSNYRVLRCTACISGNANPQRSQKITHDTTAKSMWQAATSQPTRALCSSFSTPRVKHQVTSREFSELKQCSPAESTQLRSQSSVLEIVPKPHKPGQRGG